MSVPYKSLWAICLVVFSLLAPISSKSQQINPKEVLITVSDVPAGKPSLFIPLIVTSDRLDLYRVVLKDVIFQGYVASIEKDDDGKVIGISFADIKAKTLPDTLTAIVKLRLKKNSSNKKSYSQETSESPDLDAVNKKKSSTKDKGLNQASIRWFSPWAFTKPTKNIEGVYAGFNSLTFASKDIKNIDERNRKKIIKQRENKKRDFYVKSLGQTLIRSKRQGKRRKEVELYKQPIVRELTFFTVTPEYPAYSKLYIPLVVGEDEGAFKVSSPEQNWEQGIVTRVISDNVLELSSSDPSMNLPTSTMVRGTIKVEQRVDSLIEELKLGPVLSEPSESISGVKVNISPSTISIGRKQINPLNLFKIE